MKFYGSPACVAAHSSTPPKPCELPCLTKIKWIVVGIVGDGWKQHLEGNDSMDFILCFVLSWEKALMRAAKLVCFNLQFTDKFNVVYFNLDTRHVKCGPKTLVQVTFDWDVGFRYSVPRPSSSTKNII